MSFQSRNLLPSVRYELRLGVGIWWLQLTSPSAPTELTVHIAQQNVVRGLTNPDW